MARSLRTLEDLTDAELRGIVDRTLVLRPAIRERRRQAALADRVVGLLFEKPSTRTRLGFEVAAGRLGGTAVHMASSELQLGRGEPIKDTARIVGSFMDAIVARVNRQETVDGLAEFAGVPVINGLSDRAHPTQIVGDLATVLDEKGDFAGLTLAYVGDANNVGHSLMLGCAKVGLDIRLACPSDYLPDEESLAAPRAAAARNGSTVVVTDDPREAVTGADIVYTDVWVSMGQDDEITERQRAFADYQVNAALMGLAAPKASVMHCLPAYRGLEITDDVMEGRASVVFEQGEMKLHSAAAILEFFCA